LDLTAIKKIQTEAAQSRSTKDGKSKHLLSKAIQKIDKRQIIFHLWQKNIVETKNALNYRTLER